MRFPYLTTLILPSISCPLPLSPRRIKRGEGRKGELIDAWAKRRRRGPIRAGPIEEEQEGEGGGGDEKNVICIIPIRDCESRSLAEWRGWGVIKILNCLLALSLAPKKFLLPLADCFPP